MVEPDPVSVANRWIAAYNAKDYDALAELAGENLHLVHHNRGVDVKSRDEAIQNMRDFDQVASSKGFHSTRRQFSAADVVVTEQSWSATAKTDIPDFIKDGETLTLELCCVWSVRDGKVVEYDDYG
jgi:ketosteroid isomerase-like protein